MIEEPKGQILPGSPFGDMLTSLAKRSEVIVEIGTWHGLGSTLCLSKGLVRDSQRMWTFEADKRVSAEAKGYYTDPRIEFVPTRFLDSVHLLPSVIDLILFDGSDEETDAEFDYISPFCRVIALDDTNERKNRRQRQTLIDTGWHILADYPHERHGWFIAERP